ncbi:MAG: PTS sugar transporter subunit IIC [Bacilli bacterium]|nr:PTS sugar transporter subunit IIC [Bacilli bacterium]
MDNSRKTFFLRCRDFLMKTTNGMAIGLFGTLIIGTIFDLFGKIPHMEGILVFSAALKALMGAGIGLGVAIATKRNGVQMVAVMAAGMIGNYAFHWIGDQQWSVISIGDPLSCYLASLCAYFALTRILKKKTPVDMLLVPLLGIGVAMLYSFLLAQWVHYVTLGLGELIRVSFAAVPFLMCIIISVLTGMALTAPISSVAICVAIQIGNVPLAAASALIGCCVQMLGFAVHTAHDNKWGSVLAVGIGTSMLQFKNIIRKPLIWLPTIIVSAILGPFAMLFPLDGIVSGSVSALSVGAGMGTSGLVGPINFLGAIGYDNWILWVLLVSVCLVGPILLVFLVDLLFRKIGWLKEGDFSL